MITLQDLAVDMKNRKPRSLYFFCGSEYGMKSEYISKISESYGGIQEEIDSLSDYAESLGKKKLLQPTPCVRVCRYDYDFLKSVDEKKSKELLSADIPGTIIVIYEDEKSTNKLDKYFPNNTVRIDQFHSNYYVKYMTSKYPELDKRYIDMVSNKCECGYGQIDIICSQLNAIHEELHRVPDDDIMKLVFLQTSSTEDQLTVATASKNFQMFMSVVDSFESDINYLINNICATMVEIDKVLDDPRQQSLVSKYVKKWSRQDVYNMFCNAYYCLVDSRSSGSSYDSYDSILCLASLLRFEHIPLYRG